jgi:thiol-disulfide isomerase/thioredoxin
MRFWKGLLIGGLLLTVFSAANAAQHCVVDPVAVRLVGDAADRLIGVQTLSAVCVFATWRSEMPGKPARVMYQTAKVRLMKPNLARTTVLLSYRKNGDKTWNKTDPFETLAADGRGVWRVWDFGKIYTHWADLPNVTMVIGPSMPISGFFDRRQAVCGNLGEFQREGLLRRLAYVGRERWEGASYRVVEFAFQNVHSDIVTTQYIYIGDDDLIHRITGVYGPGITYSCDLRDLKVNEPMSRQDFGYQPPAGYKPDKSTQPQPPSPTGRLAPSFSVFGRDGKSLSSKQFHGKVVVLDFWATWCGPCQREMKVLVALAKRYPQVVFLAVSTGDNVTAFRAWMPKHPELAPLTCAIDPEGINGKGVDARLFPGSGLPSTYVIDRSGRITAFFYGYGGEGAAPYEAAIKAAMGTK